MAGMVAEVQCGVVLVAVGGLQFQVVGFEDLVAAEAPQVVDTIAAHQKLGFFVLTARHDTRDSPILGNGLYVSSPQNVGARVGVAGRV